MDGWMDGWMDGYVGSGSRDSRSKIKENQGLPFLHGFKIAEWTRAMCVLHHLSLVGDSERKMWKLGWCFCSVFVLLMLLMMWYESVHPSIHPSIHPCVSLVSDQYAWQKGVPELFRTGTWAYLRSESCVLC